MAATYVTKVNNTLIAASEVVPNSPLANKLATLVSGAFEVVSLNQSSKPDVANPSTKIIYLTKDSTATILDPYTEWIYTGTDGESAVASKWEVIGTTSMNLDDYKKTQTAYTASGLGTAKTITSLTQNANGEISATASDIQSASTSQKGIVKLVDSTSSTSTADAATPNSVKTAYDLANGKYTKPSDGIPKTDLTSAVQASLDKADAAISGAKVNSAAVTVTDNALVLSADGTYSTTNKLATQSTVTNAINALDVTEIGGSDTYIKSISETNGLVSATTATFPTIPAAANNGVLQVKINNGTATDKFSANQSTNSTLSFTTGTTNGTIKVDSTEVPVAGLKSAAYTESGAYATSAQGTKADNAVSGVTVAGTSVVTNHVAAIPSATSAVYGVVTITTETI